MNKNLLCLFIIVLLLGFTACNSNNIQAYKGTSLMKKYLKSYKRRDFKNMKKYVKKMKHYSEDTSLKKMTDKNKTRYLKKIKSFSKNHNGIMFYYLADLDKDRKPELLLEDYYCEAGRTVYIYTYKKGKVKYIGKEYASQAYFCTYPGKGIVKSYGHMGIYGNTHIYIENNKIKKVKYGEINFDKLKIFDFDKYYPKMILYNHRKYLKNYKSKIDYSPLK